MKAFSDTFDQFNAPLCKVLINLTEHSGSVCTCNFLACLRDF